MLLSASARSSSRPSSSAIARASRPRRIASSLLAGEHQEAREIGHDVCLGVGAGLVSTSASAALDARTRLSRRPEARTSRRSAPRLGTGFPSRRPRAARRPPGRARTRRCSTLLNTRPYEGEASLGPARRRPKLDCRGVVPPRRLYEPRAYAWSPASCNARLAGSSSSAVSPPAARASSSALE